MIVTQTQGVGLAQRRSPLGGQPNVNVTTAGTDDASRLELDLEAVVDDEGCRAEAGSRDRPVACWLAREDLAVGRRRWDDT